jgi:hypothetical protein
MEKAPYRSSRLLKIQGQCGFPLFVDQGSLVPILQTEQAAIAIPSERASLSGDTQAG